MSATDEDRDAYAVGALDYDEAGLYLEDPLATEDDVTAPGGDPVAITMGAVGAVGPDAGLHPATPGRVYSSKPSFTITGDDPARWLGLFVDGDLRRTVPLKSPIGPGTFPVVYAAIIP